ncbi:hypothetical protein [Flavobacterium pedocola]
MKNKRLIVIITTILVLLSIPLIAMQFTNEVDWKPFDFIIAGILLFATGLTCEFVMRKITNKRNRIVLIALLLLALFLIWAELAVGIFGTPIAGS